MTNQYLSSASLKKLARGQLLGKYGTAAGATILMQLCTTPISLAISFLIGTDSLISIFLYSAALLLLEIFIGFFLAGEALIYLKTACSQRPAVNDLFHFFRNSDAPKIIRFQAIAGGISVLSTMPSLIVGMFMTQSLQLISEDDLLAGDIPVDPVLFLIYVILYLAGIIVTLFVNLMLSQVYYLMLDFPGYSASQVIKMSIQLMKGNKGRLFYIQLSFIPLILLSFLSCGIGLFWIHPYMEAVYANFYLDLVKKAPPWGGTS